MRTGRRPWVAALLSFVQPGAGHLYLREWGRGITWFVLWSTTALLATGVSAPSVSIAGVVAFVETFLLALGDLQPIQSLALAAVTGFAIVDAYWLAARRDRRSSDAPSCPNCSRDVDLSIGFCHWCTVQFDVVDGRDDASR